MSSAPERVRSNRIFNGSTRNGPQAFVTARSCGGTSSGKGSAGRCGSSPNGRLAADGRKKAEVQSLIGRVPQGHWKTITFVAALRRNGVRAPCTVDGSMNGAKFLAYVEQCLAPTLKRKDIVVI